MKSIVTLALVACVPVREGVQIGEEKVEIPPSCEPEESVVPEGDPRRAALDALPLQAEVSPSWQDGGEDPLTVDLSWDEASLRLVTWVLVPGVESCPPEELLVDIRGQIRSASGLLDEEVLFDEVRLLPDEGGIAQILIPVEEVGGSLDADAIAVEELGEIDRNVGLELMLELVPGAPSHGHAVVVAWPERQGPPASPDETIQREIAVW